MSTGHRQAQLVGGQRVVNVALLAVSLGVRIVLINFQMIKESLFRRETLKADPGGKKRFIMVVLFSDNMCGFQILGRA